MSDVVLAECIYVRRTKAKLGTGGTSRENILESLWFPYNAKDGYVELYPVMDNLKSIMRLIERVPVELFKNEYAAMDDSRDIYLKLKPLVP